MPLFEVFIPAATADGFNITARISAESWIQALRNGLTRLGDTADVRNILCDITATGIDVTEPQSGRVFRIRELPETEHVPAPAAAPAPALIVHPPQAADDNDPTPNAAPHSPLTDALHHVSDPEPVVLTPKPPPEPVELKPKPVPVVLTPKRASPEAPAPASTPAAPKKSGIFPSAQRFLEELESDEVTQQPAADTPKVHIGRGRVEQERSVEDILGELLDRTQEIYEHESLESAAGFMIDLAMQTIKADSAAVFIADINRNDLYFATARGPKAAEVMGFRVPAGKGIVGFCVQSGVSLAVSDVHKDPHFYAAISKGLGYETRSILCSPAQQGGRVFGALELINRVGGDAFTGDEVNVLNFLAHEFSDYLVNTGQTGD